MSDAPSVVTASSDAPVARVAPIPRYLPAWQPHFLSGPPGGGKTCLLASVVKALLAGEPVFGKQAQPIPFVGLIAADREWSDGQQWYQAAGCPPLPYFSLVDSDVPTSKLKKPGYPLQLLDDILTEHFKAPPNALLIIDPISYWTGGDMNRYMQVYLAMLDLNRFCLRHHVTIIGLAHTGKQKADSKERYARPQDRINGSAALLGCSGTQMALETPDQTDSEYYRFTWVPHHAPAESFDLERDEATGLFLEVGKPASDQPTFPGVKWPDVLTLIPEAPRSPITPKLLLSIAAKKRIAISRPTLYRCLQTWLDGGLIEQTAPGFYQRPKPQ